MSLAKNISWYCLLLIFLKASGSPRFLLQMITHQVLCYQVSQSIACIKKYTLSYSICTPFFESIQFRSAFISPPASRAQKTYRRRRIIR